MKWLPIFPLTPEELAVETTRYLLARRKRLLQCRESSALPDESELGEIICYKNTPGWIAAYRDLKLELAKRGHVPKGAEAANLRKARGLRGRTLEKRAGRPARKV